MIHTVSAFLSMLCMTTLLPSVYCSVLSVKGATWHMEQEKLPENAGSQIAELAKAKPLRAAIVLDEPVREAEVKVAWHVVR